MKKIGKGILGWLTTERQTDRYGQISISKENVNHTHGQLGPIHREKEGGIKKGQS